MIITLNKNIISIDQFRLKCSVGKGGIKKKIKEGDKITPKGSYFLDKLYYRSDRIKKLRTKLKRIIIKKNMGWSDDPRSKHYNRKISLKKNYKYSYEKLYRKDHNYDLLIPIKYNYKNPIKNKGSAIFLHLTNNYKPTAGCIALKKKDFLVMLNLINKKTKIIIV
tara:strand:+ start:667 stop:1161 length:495 start_codon:yes stop_codon:yes gene_type:complete